MYYPAIITSIGISISLIPFLIPIRLKNPIFRKIKAILIISLIISIFVSITPDKAQTGAPFHKYGKAKIAFFGCNYQIMLTQARFCSENATFEWCYCNNWPAFSTIAHCYNVGFPEEIDSLLGMCNEFNKTLSRINFEHAENYYLMNSKPVEQHDGFSTYPAKINDSETYYFKHAYEQFLGNYDISVDHGVYLFMYWVVVLVIVSLSNWFKIIFPGITKKLIDPVTNWFRKNITTPATNGKNKTNELPMGKFFDMLVPSRMETLILLGASIVCLKLLVVDIDYVENDPLFHTKREAILRFYAVRTSLLASALMPLLILFGGRNNFLQWVTRWDYSTFIMFHRWISRAVVGLIFIHSFFYAWYIKIRSVELQPYMFWGAAALWAGLAILVQGLLVLRRKWYEVFLLLHIVLAAVFVFGAWVHVNELYCVWFYYTSAAIWGFDRIIRICRLYSFGFPEAKVYLLPDDTLKVVVPKPENWEAVPGGHVFIHFLRWDCFWQSHPFTYVDSESHITLFIKVKKGVTKSLRDYLVLKHDKFTTIRVAVEGSYGESTPARYADTTFFIAGGSGIPGIYSEAVDLKKSNPNSRQKVKLIWVVRDYQSLLWFHEELLALKETNIDATIYVTRPNNAIDESTQLLSPQKVISEIKSICQVYEGRPNIGKLIEQQVEESTNSVAVITCGHPAMVDEVRYSTCQSIDNPQGKRVDYYEMLQVWA